MAKPATRDPRFFKKSLPRRMPWYSCSSSTRNSAFRAADCHPIRE